jgi:hypothetical protein
MFSCVSGVQKAVSLAGSSRIPSLFSRGSKPSQNDIFILARSDTDLVSIAVEGKVDEPFGGMVRATVAEATYLLSMNI